MAHFKGEQGAYASINASQSVWRMGRLPLVEVLHAVSRCAPRYHVHARASSGCSSNGWMVAGGAMRRRLQLHPCFASSLRLAQVHTLTPTCAGVCVGLSLESLVSGEADDCSKGH